MSGTIDVLLKACSVIEKAIPVGLPDKVKSLGDRYTDLSQGFLAAQERAVADTHTVTNNTWGSASDAFEHYSKALTQSLQQHGQAAKLVTSVLEEFAAELKSTHDKVFALTKKALDLLKAQKADEAYVAALKPGTLHLTVAVDPKLSSHRIHLAQQLVKEAKAEEHKLVAKAERLGHSIATKAHDLHLPTRDVAKSFETKYRPHTYAFSGGFGVHKTVGVDTQVVSGMAKNFLNNAHDMESALGKALAGMHPDFGNDEAGHAFAKGYKQGWHVFVKAHNKAPEHVAFIGHGLNSMVSRHNHNDHEAQATFEQIQPGGQTFLGEQLAGSGGGPAFGLPPSGPPSDNTDPTDPASAPAEVPQPMPVPPG